ncbi:MAG TPA: class I SAM-dependent methyltransferase [Thermoanaerobaculia bacterium]|jgi:SAM-dependent methyltransferase|nr:class I SAM-dependent methyltransferase [Thermoanaerobaculia bacterium]
MPVTVLYPRFDHPAVEERFASWQTQMLLRASGAELLFHDQLDDVETEYVLVVTDPLLLPSRNLPQRLASLIVDADATVPVTNEAADERQFAGERPPYITLRELQTVFEKFEQSPARTERITWRNADPGAFCCRTAWLRTVKGPLQHAIANRNVVVSHNDYVHRWSSMRGQARIDLLDRIPVTATSLLEFGCGEAPLGAAIKARQKCRVVGVELDPRAVAIARKRIDAIFQGDVREIVSLVHERFDWIVGGDIVEHLDEPWSFLSELRRISKPGGHLLLSLPNLANVSVVNDLLRGRFDYVYMGLTCAGHVRFFTRRSIEDMLHIAGWDVESIESQAVILTPAAEELLAKLDASGAEYSRDDLLSPGYYVTAVNR